MRQRTEVIAELFIARTTFGGICNTLFWMFQVFVVLAGVAIALDLTVKGAARGWMLITPVLLFWIGGSIVLGIGALLGTEVYIVRPQQEPTQPH